MLHSKKGCKDQESIQSSTTHDPGYQWESDKRTVIHHKREPRGQRYIKLKGITISVATWPQIFCLQTPDPGVGVKMSIFHFFRTWSWCISNKGNHKCSNIVSNILLGSIGQKSTFSEHDHVAYRNKGNHEMQQHGHTMVDIVRNSLVYFFIELTTEN